MRKDSGRSKEKYTIAILRRDFEAGNKYDRRAKRHKPPHSKALRAGLIERLSV